MNKNFYFSVVAIGVIAFTGGVLSQLHPSDLVPSRADTNHTLTLNSSSTPDSITSSYQNNVTGSVTTSLGHGVEMTFVNAKTLSGGFVELAPHGKIFNFGSTNNQLTGINGIAFTGSGSFVFKPAVTKGILAEMDSISVSAGAAAATIPNCDYFEIEAGDSGAAITTMSFSYSCDAAAYDTKLLNGTYTGVGDDSYTYKLVVNNGSATLSSLDKPSNISLSGTAALSSKTAATFSFTNLTVNMTYDGHALTFVSKSGSNAGACPQVDLNRVYTLENFESYSATGQGYTNSTTKYQTTGLRAHYYADFSSTGTGEIGGSGWPVMTSTDNTNYNSSKGHNGSKVGIFKFSNGSNMRYFSMNELYGVSSIAGKGTTLSVWVRGAYTNTNFNTNYSKDVPMRAYAFYGTPLNPSNQTTVREAFDFTVCSGSEWQHFEFTLTAGRTYYGFGFNSSQSTGANVYIPIDDVQIYTASPYAEYSVYPEGTFSCNVSVLSYSWTLILAIGNRSNGLVNVRFSNTDASATSISFNNSTNLVTITTTGSYSSYTYGKITGTYDPANNRITGVGCDGSIKSYVSNNGSLIATRPTTSSTVYYNDCDGTTTQLQSTFKRRYNNGSWQVDTSNTDRITSNTAQFVSGTNSVKRRGWADGPVAFNLNSDWSSAKTLESIQYWVYNPSSSDITLRMWGYTAKNFGSNFETGSITATANGWTYVAMGFTSAKIYNFQIADFGNTGVNISIDNIYLY